MGKGWEFLNTPVDQIDFQGLFIASKKKATSVYVYCSNPGRWILPLLVLGVFAIFWLPGYQVRNVEDTDKRIELEDKTRSTWTQIVIALSVGLYFAHRNALIAERNALVAERNALVAEKNAQVTEKNLSLTERKQEADRFSEATKLLSSPNAYERLAGINMLGQIGLTSDEYAWLVYESLTAYLREKHPSDPETFAKLQFLHLDSESEVHAAVGVICRLSSIKFRLLNSIAYGHLKAANLSGVHLRGTRFFNATLQLACFERADLTGVAIADTILSMAKFNGACLSMAQLERVSLVNADISFSQLAGVTLVDVDLSGANFYRAKLYTANLVNVGDSLTQVQIDQAYGDYSTKLPTHLVMPDHWEKFAGPR